MGGGRRGGRRRACSGPLTSSDPKNTLGRPEKKKTTSLDASKHPKARIGRGGVLTLFFLEEEAFKQTEERPENY